jgi:hypothetical protein
MFETNFLNCKGLETLMKRTITAGLVLAAFAAPRLRFMA